jgi:hypothetical protein
MSEPYDSAAETIEHIRQVERRLNTVCVELRERGQRHDLSKLGKNEKPLFDEMTPKLKNLTYGTDEYKASLKGLGPALQHHYANNSHHPEHYPDGIAGMDLLDLIEMYCDWAAASLRTKDGDMSKSIEISIERFGIDGPLADIIRNTWTRHGGFRGYTDYYLGDPPKDMAGPEWTDEQDMGTGQIFSRRPMANEPFPETK